MHTFFHSRRPRSQEPQQAVPCDGVAVLKPKPKSSGRIREFFRLGRSSSQNPRRIDPSHPIVVPSSRPSLEDGTSWQVTRPSIDCAPPPPTAGPGQVQDVLAVPQPSSAISSQLSLVSRGSTIPPHQHSPQSHDKISDVPSLSQSIWNINERGVRVDGNNNNVNYLINSSNQFMEKLLDKTIQGAAFDSSDRDPPPRCHPGTRLAVIARCLEFIANAVGKKKLRWVVGAAGVGKSAIMQNVAESPLPSVSECASIFLSINGRNDGSKIIMTLAYQLADQCELYRQYVEHTITHHPSLLRSSMSVQFKKFLVEPFVDTPLSSSVGHILIIIDGLDECDRPETQRELLRLITGMCSTHLSSPIVWIVASRPEHHLTSFFAQDDVQAVYEKEEILVDSDEARRDVERFLRAELTRIQKEFSLSPGSQWPREQDFWKLAGAAGGLFIYAQTVSKYIGDLTIADPISQLGDVLKVIDALPLSGVPRNEHPLVLLDALYARILSKVPKRVMVNTRKILLALVLDAGSDPRYRQGGFLVLCNWLGMTCDDAYTAVRHLGSALDVPSRDEARVKKIQPFHKSFIDYISDFTRSGFSSDIAHKARELDAQYTIRVLTQAPSGIDCCGENTRIYFSSGLICARLASVTGAGSNIVLPWPASEDSNWSDSRTRLELYKWSCLNVVDGIRTGQPAFCTDPYIRTVITQLRAYVASGRFPYRALANVVFEQSRRHEFMMTGLLKTVSLRELHFNCIVRDVKLRFRCPSGTTTKPSDPWNSSCKHTRTGNWGEGKDEDWMTEFRVDTNFGCHSCCQRLKQQLENRTTLFPDHDVTLLLTSAQHSFAEFHFIDPDDGVSEWTYWIVLDIPDQERRKPGRAV